MSAAVPESVEPELCASVVVAVLNEADELSATIAPAAPFENEAAEQGRP
jgi:hypothetical protein